MVTMEWTPLVLTVVIISWWMVQLLTEVKLRQMASSLVVTIPISADLRFEHITLSQHANTSHSVYTVQHVATSLRYTKHAWHSFHSFHSFHHFIDQQWNHSNLYFDAMFCTQFARDSLYFDSYYTSSKSHTLYVTGQQRLYNYLYFTTISYTKNKKIKNYE